MVVVFYFTSVICYPWHRAFVFPPKQRCEGITQSGPSDPAPPCRPLAPTWRTAAKQSRMHRFVVKTDKQAAPCIFWMQSSNPAVIIDENDDITISTPFFVGNVA